jgi:hypothetical protein
VSFQSSLERLERLSPGCSLLWANGCVNIGFARFRRRPPFRATGKNPGLGFAPLEVFAQRSAQTLVLGGFSDVCHQ